MNPSAGYVEEVRLDKWLWAVRLYKTRALAAQACQEGKVVVDKLQLKPSRSVKPGQIISVRLDAITRTLKVVALVDRRVGPKLVAHYMEDLTPASEFLKQMERKTTVPSRPKGSGRPTKKERRLLEEHGFL